MTRPHDVAPFGSLWWLPDDAIYVHWTHPRKFVGRPNGRHPLLSISLSRYAGAAERVPALFGRHGRFNRAFVLLGISENARRDYPTSFFDALRPLAPFLFARIDPMSGRAQAARNQFCPEITEDEKKNLAQWLRGRGGRRG